MSRGVIRSRGDFSEQDLQDRFIEEEYLIDTHILDLLFKNRLGQNLCCRVTLLTDRDSIISSTGDYAEYNFTNKPIQIGIRGLQKVVVEAQIKPSQFIRNSIIILALSLIMVTVPLLSLIYLVTTLRKREHTIKRREISINGIIHDLKSPLVGICAMLDLYKILEKDNIKREIIESNIQGVMLLSSRIERLLGAAKDKIGICKSEISKEEIESRVDILINDLKRHYTHKCIEVEVCVKIEEKTYIDNLCFDSAITNLVENSLKYSHENVQIYLYICSSKEQLKIIIRDNGIGIAKKDQKHIFKHMYRGKNSNAKGYGIGLAYLKALAIAHGGDVRLIESSLGNGCKFEVTLDTK